MATSRADRGEHATSIRSLTDRRVGHAPGSALLRPLLVVLVGLTAGTSIPTAAGAALGRGARPVSPATALARAPRGERVPLASAPLSDFAATSRTPGHRGGGLLTALPSGSTTGSRSPILLGLSLVGDSGGGKPSPGSVVRLGFEPSGAAYLYAASKTEDLAYHGTWTDQGGQIALRFGEGSFHVDARFSLDPSQGRATLPFQVFSSKKGSSTWKLSSFDLASGTQLEFDASISDSALHLSPTAAVGRAYAYAEAWLSAARGQHQAPGARLAARTASPRSALATGIKNLGDSLEFEYAGYPPLVLMLDASLESQDGTGQGTPLSQGALSNDPRVYLDPARPGSSASDPPNKRALLVAPFMTYFKTLVRLPFVEDNVTSGDLAEVHKVLQDRGFLVSELVGGEVTVANLVHAFGNGGAAPGVIAVLSHGNSSGVIATGQTVPDEYGLPDTGPFYRELQTEGLGGLLHGAAPKLEFSFVDPVLPGTSPRWRVTVTPSFWSWLRSDRQVDFGHSLFYMGACLTDPAHARVPGWPLLRDAIDAGAYFAYGPDSPVDRQLAVQVLKYIVASVARPTHSAEETYYNLLRVAKTGQMIYKEDTLLNGFIEPSDPTRNLAGLLNAYGYDSSTHTLVSYRTSGWLDTHALPNPGQVWFLLFAERWSHDTKVGSKNILDCWQQKWSSGQLGGLGDIFCQNANAGSTPTQDEVDYAVYLLTGKKLAFTGTFVPRWTLDDGG